MLSADEFDGRGLQLVAFKSERVVAPFRPTVGPAPFDLALVLARFHAFEPDRRLPHRKAIGGQAADFDDARFITVLLYCLTVLHRYPDIFGK